MDEVVSADWLDERLGDARLRVIDCSVRYQPPGDLKSGRAEWEAAHVPGAVFVDHLELADKTAPLPMMMPSAQRAAQALGQLGIGDDNYTVIYDRTDNTWAARLWWMLRAIGYDQAAILDGGWKAWTAGDRPIKHGVERASPADLTPTRRSDVFVDAATVLEATKNNETRLVSALSREVHEGGLFGRPGYIPTSRSVPSDLLIHPDTNRLIAVDNLRDLLQPELASRRVIAYCGGGIASSLLALSLHVAGHPAVSVYDGSLVEWCADSSLPLAAPAAPAELSSA